MENTVKITLWDNTVGYLTWDSSDWRKESSVFKFDSSFLEKGLDISPLQMSINSPARKAGIPVRGGNPKDLFKGLPPVFADSLPDYWGNSIFRAWAKEHGVSMKRISPVDFLACAFVCSLRLPLTLPPRCWDKLIPRFVFLVF